MFLFLWLATFVEIFRLGSFWDVELWGRKGYYLGNPKVTTSPRFSFLYFLYTINPLSPLYSIKPLFPLVLFHYDDRPSCLLSPCPLSPYSLSPAFIPFARICPALIPSPSFPCLLSPCPHSPAFLSLILFSLALFPLPLFPCPHSFRTHMPLELHVHK